MRIREVDPPVPEEIDYTGDAGKSTVPPVSMEAARLCFWLVVPHLVRVVTDARFLDISSRTRRGCIFMYVLQMLRGNTGGLPPLCGVS